MDLSCSSPSLGCVVRSFLKKEKRAGCWWLMPIILATQEAEIRRIMVRNQPGQIVCETLSGKSLSQKRSGGVVQGVEPEFKSSTTKKEKKSLLQICY
jgi:hypothetical protein